MGKDPRLVIESLVFLQKHSRRQFWNASSYATGMSMLCRTKQRQQLLVTPKRLYRRINFCGLAKGQSDATSNLTLNLPPP